MRTKEEDVTQEVAVWAIPDKYEQTDKPFIFKLSTITPWEEGAVKVCTEQVTITVPEGINLMAKAVETLEGLKDEEVAEHNTRLANLDAQIQNLLRLTHDSGE